MARPLQWGIIAPPFSLAAAPALDTEPEFRKPKLSGSNFNPYQAAQDFIAELMGGLKTRCDSLASDGVSASLFDRQGLNCLRVVHDGVTKYSLDVGLGGIGGDASLSFHGQQGEVRSSPGTSNAWGDMVWDRDEERAILRFHDLSLLGHVPDPDGRTFLTDEFINAVWEKICDGLEGRY